MKSSLRLIIPSAAVFLFCVALLWQIASHFAADKTVETLRTAPDSFRSVCENSIDGLLWYASRLALDDIGRTARALPVEEMRKLVRTHHLDEMNIIASNGVVLASSLSTLVGRNVRNEPAMKPVFDMMDTSAKFRTGMQPFRRGIGSDRFCKYFNLEFPDQSGFLQVGFTLEHYVRSVHQIDDYNYTFWAIGQYGYYEAIDRDGDGFIDPALSLESDWRGACEKVFLPSGIEAYTMEFDCLGLRYRAVIPMHEYYAQRTKVVIWAGLIAGAFFLVLIVFLVKIVNTSGKLEEINQELSDKNEKDLAAARTIQLSSLQRAEIFRVAELDCTFSAVTYPAKQVGGDLYGMFDLANGNIAIAVGDVSGKGVPAAMFMHVAKNTFELRARSYDDVTEAVAQANEYLCERNSADMFVTGWFASVNPTTGIVEYVNAGHNYPFVVRANGFVERLDGKGGRFLGMFPRSKYRMHRFKLNRGDQLFIYTDGVTEAMNRDKKVYGESRLVSLLGRHPQDLCAAVKDDVDAFVDGAEQSDDLTMLVLTYHGRPERIAQTFPADSDSLAGMIEFVRGTLRFQYRKQESRLLNAVDEVLANVVNYSSALKVTIVVENIPGRCRVTVIDSGEAYNPLFHQDPDTHLKLGDRPIGGLGILMAKRLVSSVKYAREDGKNILSLVQLDFSGEYRQQI